MFWKACGTCAGLRSVSEQNNRIMFLGLSRVLRVAEVFEMFGANERLHGMILEGSDAMWKVPEAFGKVRELRSRGTNGIPPALVFSFLVAAVAAAFCDHVSFPGRTAQFMVSPVALDLTYVESESADPSRRDMEISLRRIQTMLGNPNPKSKIQTPKSKRPVWILDLVGPGQEAMAM